MGKPLNGKKLKELREKRGDSPTQVGAAIGKSSQTIINVEAGFSTMPGTANALADYYGVELDEISECSS